MFAPEPAMRYACDAASYDADPRRALPTSVCPSKIPIGVADWARAVDARKPRLNRRMTPRVAMECIGSDLAWLLGACVLLRARDDGLRDGGLQRSDVGEITADIRAHILPIREQHDG